MTRDGGMAPGGGLIGLRADRMVDVEAGEVREGAVVLVRGERIEAVLDPGAPLPEGRRRSTCPATPCSPG